MPSYNEGMNDSFTQTISQICGLETATLIGNYKYTLFGGRTAVVEGHKGIAQISTQRISFVLPCGTLNIDGHCLKLKCFDKNFAVVVGDIFRTEVQK